MMNGSRGRVQKGGLLFCVLLVTGWALPSLARVHAPTHQRPLVINFGPAGQRLPEEIIQTGAARWTDTRGFGWVQSPDVLGMRSQEADPFRATIAAASPAQRTPAIFAVGLPNGRYVVEVVVGDPQYESTAEVFLQGDSVSLGGGRLVPAGTYFVERREVDVTDGRLQLELRMQMIHGAPFASITAMRVFPEGTPLEIDAIDALDQLAAHAAGDFVAEAIVAQRAEPVVEEPVDVAPEPVVAVPAPEPAPAPAPEPEPVVVAPAPEPEPVVAAPAPAPEPEPVVAAPAPAPEPEPVVAAPAPEPAPEPVVVAPSPAPAPEPAPAPAPAPEPEPEPVVAAPAPAPAPVVQPRVEEAVMEQEADWLAEPLRDPFWPVGFYPPDWDRMMSGDEAPVDTGDWEAARAQIRISGTSRMGGRIAAIINGEIKTAGDTVEVTYGGTVYRWRVVNIDAAGRVQLQKMKVE